MGQACERLAALTFPVLFQELIQAATDGRTLPHEVVSQIVAKTDAIVSVAKLDEQAVARGCACLLSLDPRPTAILCATDALAIRLIKIAAKHSIDVPEDLSVIGFDNVPASAYVAPGLTTFDQRIQDSATIQAAMLSRLVDKGIDSVQPRLLKANLVARGSHTYAPTAF